MVEINLFQPGRLDLSFDFPTIWDELSPGELRLFAHAIDHNKSKIELLASLIENRAGKRLPKDWLARLDHELAAIEGLPLIDHLIENNTLTINPLPYIRRWFTRYYGPADDFNDLTTGEFEDCETFFIKYAQTQDPEQLSNIVTVLYRPKKRGERLPHKGFSDKPSFSHKLDPVTLQLVFLWYTGCRSRLPQCFPRVFNSGDTLSNGEPDLMAVATLIHNGAGPKNGTRDHVRRTPIKEFLFDCELMIEQQDKQEEELEKIRKQR